MCVGKRKVKRGWKSISFDVGKIKVENEEEDENSEK